MNYVFLKESLARPHNIVSQELTTYDCGGTMEPIITGVDSVFMGNDKTTIYNEQIEFEEHNGKQFVQGIHVSYHVTDLPVFSQNNHHNGNKREVVAYNSDGKLENIIIYNEKGNIEATFTIDNRGVRLFEKGIEVDPNNYEKYLWSESFVNLIPDLLK